MLEVVLGALSRKHLLATSSKSPEHIFTNPAMWNSEILIPSLLAELCTENLWLDARLKVACNHISHIADDMHTYVSFNIRLRSLTCEWETPWVFAERIFSKDPSFSGADKQRDEHPSCFLHSALPAFRDDFESCCQCMTHCVPRMAAITCGCISTLELHLQGAETSELERSQ